MPIKVMRSLCFHGRTSPSRISISSPRRTSLSESMIERSIESAEAMILKWNPDSSPYAGVTSIFYENKIEALNFIKLVNGLQKAMRVMVSESSTSEKLTHAQSLMQIAMKRLQKEFYQILSMNRANLDPESVSARSSRCSARSSTTDFDDDAIGDDEFRVAGDSISEVEEVSLIAMADLRSIAECMISSGYAKECISIYKIIRKSIVDEGIYRLGVEKHSSSQISKMDWEVLELRIKNWLEAIKIAMKTLFIGEQMLCNHVFASSNSIRESCFSEISKEGAMLLFSLPELVAKSKKSPAQKIFRLLDMYVAIADHSTEIESTFSSESTSSGQLQAFASLVRLGESIRAMLSDFESSLQKDSSKSVVYGGGIHSLTIKTMNYLSLLSDYNIVLTDIFADWTPPKNSSLSESYFDGISTDISLIPMVSLRVAWLILVLLCKLDGKAKQYKDISMAYLFLTNNLQHVVTEVKKSNLRYLLGDEWISKQETKVRQFAANYEHLVWGRVFSSLPENPTAIISPTEAKDMFRKFNMSFDEACRKQKHCVLLDDNLRDEIKVSLAIKLVPIYREFYNTHRSRSGPRPGEKKVRFSPEDVVNHLSAMFVDPIDSGRTSPSSSTTSISRSI